MVTQVKTELRKLSDYEDQVLTLSRVWHFLSPSNVIDCETSIQIGCLFGPIRCLSSPDPHVRSIANSVLQRFYCHLESGADFARRDFWTGFINNIRCLMKTCNEQLPSIVTSFLSHSTNVLTTPVHQLQESILKIVANYKKSIDIWKGLKTLLKSSDPSSHIIQTSWALHIINESCENGSNNDVMDLLNQGIIDLLIKMVSSHSTSLETKINCMTIIENCSRHEFIAKRLCFDHSIHSFLLVLAIDLSRASPKLASQQLIDVVINISKNIQQVLDLTEGNKIKEEKETSHIMFYDGQNQEMKKSRKRRSCEINESKKGDVKAVSLCSFLLFGHIITLLGPTKNSTV